MSATDLDQSAVKDPAVEADNALSEKLITYVLWIGGGVFTLFVVAIALFV